MTTGELLQAISTPKAVKDVDFSPASPIVKVVLEDNTVWGCAFNDPLFIINTKHSQRVFLPNNVKGKIIYVISDNIRDYYITESSTEDNKSKYEYRIYCIEGENNTLRQIKLLKFNNKINIFINRPKGLFAYLHNGICSIYKIESCETVASIKFSAIKETPFASFLESNTESIKILSKEYPWLLFSILQELRVVYADGRLVNYAGKIQEQSVVVFNPYNSSTSIFINVETGMPIKSFLGNFEGGIISPDQKFFLTFKEYSNVIDVRNIESGKLEYNIKIEDKFISEIKWLNNMSLMVQSWDGICDNKISTLHFLKKHY